MNMTREGAKHFFQQLEQHPKKIWHQNPALEVILAVPYLLTDCCLRAAEGSGIRIAAQNVHAAASGAYTGEVSIPMLKEAGIGITLVGHSERRQYYHETDQSALKKIQACLTAGLRPILCIGETLREREQNRTAEVIARQLRGLTESIADCKDLILAYEPVWAIGTGLAATADQAQQVHQQIRTILKNRYGEGGSRQVRILYGGSMKPSNISELIEKPDIDGGLVGGSSLNASEFAQMLLCAARA